MESGRPAAAGAPPEGSGELGRRARVAKRNLNPRPWLVVHGAEHGLVHPAEPQAFPEFEGHHLSVGELALLAPGAEGVALIKPQFEVGRGQVGKGGVVRDPGQHMAVVERVLKPKRNDRTPIVTVVVPGEIANQVRGIMPREEAGSDA